MDARDDDRSRALGAGHDVMNAPIFIARLDEIAEGKGKAFDVGEKRIAIFQVDGQLHAIDDACPHAGASLSEGYLEDGNVGCRGIMRSSNWPPANTATRQPPVA